ncbi:MAG: hypothetical protein LBP22_00385 [Deltaproteobacteria bacterium]|jgi:MinD superfamily P-loop ATPase|nr:hypothetical protein [Deltaproteobacteria bacterium]
MSEIVTFINSKGGQGKTTLAVNYALYNNCHYHTNDYLVTSALFKAYFPDNFFHEITPNMVQMEMDGEVDAVIDFGGYIDNKMPDIIKASKLCVIPIYYLSQSDLLTLHMILEQIARINNNIAIVINNTSPSFIAPLSEALKRDYQYEIKIIKPSSYMTYLVNHGLTPFNIRDMKGAAKKPLEQLRAQLTELFSFINEYQPH